MCGALLLPPQTPHPPPSTRARHLGRGSANTSPITWQGKPPYVVGVDELASESVRIIDLSEETNPSVVRHLQLEIQRPENADVAADDTVGNGFSGYDAHYCTVDREVDPMALACGFFQSGVRVFPDLPGSEHAGAPPTTQGSNTSDIRDAGPGGLTNSRYPAVLNADYCSSPPRFVGLNELWVSCQDNGFLALRFTNKAYRRS